MVEGFFTVVFLTGLFVAVGVVKGRLGGVFTGKGSTEKEAVDNLKSKSAGYIDWKEEDSD